MIGVRFEKENLRTSQDQVTLLANFSPHLYCPGRFPGIAATACDRLWLPTDCLPFQRPALSLSRPDREDRLA